MALELHTALFSVIGKASVIITVYEKKWSYVRCRGNESVHERKRHAFFLVSQRNKIDKFGDVRGMKQIEE